MHRYCFVKESHDLFKLKDPQTLCKRVSISVGDRCLYRVYNLEDVHCDPLIALTDLVVAKVTLLDDPLCLPDGTYIVKGTRKIHVTDDISVALLQTAEDVGKSTVGTLLKKTCETFEGNWLDHLNAASWVLSALTAEKVFKTGGLDGDGLFYKHTITKEYPNTEYLPEGVYDVKNSILILHDVDKAMDATISIEDQLLYSPEDPQILSDDSHAFCVEATPLTECTIDEGCVIYTEDGTIIDLAHSWLAALHFIISVLTLRSLSPPSFDDIYNEARNLAEIPVTYVAYYLAILVAAGVIGLIPCP